MNWKAFWKDAGIRAARTMAQTAVGVIGTASVLSEVNWKVALSSAALAGIVSLLMSLDRIGQNGGSGNEAH